MSDLRNHFHEDRSIRDAAREVLGAQFNLVRHGLSGKRIGEGLADKVGDPALDLVERSGGSAKAGAGLLALVAGLAALWLKRESLGSLLESLMPSSEEEEPTETSAESEISDDA